MNTPLHQKLVALGLAALVTAGVLGSLDGLASYEVARHAPALWAGNDTTPAAAPAPAPRG